MISLVISTALMLQAAPLETVAHTRVTSEDGTALALYRIEPAQISTPLKTVVVFTEFGFGRSLVQGGPRSLAAFLTAHSVRVYIAQVRGQGASAGVATLDDVVLRDVPALLRRVNREVGEVDVIAHGWLGSLVLAAVALPEVKVRRVMALATPVTPEVPSQWVEHFLEAQGSFARLAATDNGVREFEGAFALWSRMSSRQLREWVSQGTRDLGPTTSAQLLRFMRAGDWAFSDGTTFTQRISAYDRPTLVLAGLADGFANAELVTPLRELSHAKVDVHVFTRLENAEDYSHLSLLLGPGAPRDVFEPLLRFLEAP